MENLLLASPPGKRWVFAGEVSYYPTYTVSQVLKFFSSFKKDSQGEVVSALGVDSLLSKKVKVLSKGELQRVGLVVALMGSPDLIFLDEPFSGLDPIAISDLKKIIKKMKSQGRVFLSVPIFWGRCKDYRQLCSFAPGSCVGLGGAFKSYFWQTFGRLFLSKGKRTMRAIVTLLFSTWSREWKSKTFFVFVLVLFLVQALCLVILDHIIPLLKGGELGSFTYQDIYEKFLFFSACSFCLLFSIPLGILLLKAIGRP